MSADTVVDIYEKPGVPYSTSADVYSTSTVGAATPPVETASVVNPGMGGGGPAPISTTPPLSFTTGTPIPAQSPVVGTPYTLDIKPYFVNGGSSRAYSIFSGSLPPGLALNGTTGVVAGTPSTPGSSTVVFRAVDNAGNAANSNGVPFNAAPANILVLLLHLEGANSSQTDPIIDSSPAAHPNLTRNALSMFSTTNVKFGLTGLQSLGGTSSIYTEVHADFGFTGDYTVELEATLSSFAFSNRTIFDGTMNGTKVGAKIVIVYDGSGEPTVTLVNSAGTTIVSSGYVSRTGFRHIRICRAGNLLYLFVDGVLIGSGPETGTYSTPCALCFVGPYGGGTGTVASVDEVRVLNGVAASTASFTRPTAPWQNVYPEIKAFDPNPALIPTNYVLSNSNKTISSTASGAATACVSETVHTTGKWYFEVQVTNTFVSFGVTKTAGALATQEQCGQNANGWGYLPGGTGSSYIAGSANAYGPITFASGRTYGFAVDLDNGKIFLAGDNVYVGTSNPVTGANPMGSGLAGAFRIAVTAYLGAPTVVTCKFAAADLLYAPPAGYTPWG